MQCQFRKGKHKRCTRRALEDGEYCKKHSNVPVKQETTELRWVKRLPEKRASREVGSSLPENMDPKLKSCLDKIARAQGLIDQAASDLNSVDGFDDQRTGFCHLQDTVDKHWHVLYRWRTRLQGEGSNPDSCLET